MNNQTKTEREGTFGSSVLVLALAIAVLLTGVVGFKLDPHIPLLFSSSIILLYGVWLRVPWKDMRDSIIKSISESIEAILIICLIGMTVGSWISSGTVPMVIYYGLKIFSPQFFLISVLVLCSIMSIMTGSSWTTIGTIGVAFMGVGYGLGIPMGITAGAIICGAFFGDKQSPLSDSTNFAAAVAKTDLYDHVRSMIYTTGPAWLVSAVFFLFLVFAALSTVLGVCENILAMVRELTGWSRPKGCVVCGVGIFLLALTTALGYSVLHFQPFAPGSAWLDFWDFIVSNNVLPLGSLVLALFCCNRFGCGWDNFVAEANTGRGLKVRPWMKPIFKYFVPGAILFIYIYGMVTFHWR